MLDTFKHLIVHQYQAGLSTLNACIAQCPESLWNSRVASYPFSQVAFHVLFFADLYLSEDEASFRRQDFHIKNQGWFGDYEQLQDREPRSTYDQTAILKYLEHCRQKVSETLSAETELTLTARCGFPWRELSRAELHVYNIRHVQHHAAQLSLRLRQEVGEGVAWFGTGWQPVPKI